MARERKKILLICRRAPYGNELARAALDVALAGGAFEQDIDVLFMDDAVWQLLPDQDAAKIGRRNIHRTLRSMPLYGIETFYVEDASLRARRLKPSRLEGNLELLDAAALPAFVESHDHVLSF